MNRRRLLARLQRGQVANVRFSDFTTLVEGFDFRCIRITGSHHIYRHRVLPAQLNLQDVRGEVKPYQVRQFLRLVERHSIRFEADELS